MYSTCGKAAGLVSIHRASPTLSAEQRRHIERIDLHHSEPQKPDPGKLVLAHLSFVTHIHADNVSLYQVTQFRQIVT